MRLGHFEARRIYSGRCSLEFISKEEKGSLGIGNASPTLFAAERRCLMYRIHSASIAGVLHTSTVQPKAGRSENIYWLCKVSLLHPPSSLGLDGHGQHLSRLEDMQKVPEKPSSSCLPTVFPCTQHPSYHQPKGYGEPSLDWLLPSQESSTSWVKKCLRLWLTNCSSLPLIPLSCMQKVYGITFLKLWENRSLWYRIPKTFAIFAVDN